jgi:hypothetical protein
MAAENSQTPANGSALEFAAQLWAAAGSFRSDLHPHLTADLILAKPPFNMSDWRGEILPQNMRRKFGLSPVNNIGLDDSRLGIKNKRVRRQWIE